MTTQSAIISQLKPFSAERFDLCMGYLMRAYRQTLSQHDLTKLHVMGDFFHVLETGKQMIGGSLQPWKHGPVVEDGYNRVGRLKHMFDDAGGEPVALGGLRVTAKNQRRYLYDPADPNDTADVDKLSPLEVESLTKAWSLISPMNFGQRETFFHGDSYMGRVWQAAGGANAPRGSRIDWGELVAAYDAAHPDDPDHTIARLTIDMWRRGG